MAEHEYLVDLPVEPDIAERLLSSIQFWQGRNSLITRVRSAIGGSNPIQAPQSAQYKVRIMHTYLMAATINEKAARFVQLPLVQVIPNSLDNENLVEASNLEKALKVAFF